MESGSLQTTCVGTTPSLGSEWAGIPAGADLLPGQQRLTYAAIVPTVGKLRTLLGLRGFGQQFLPGGQRFGCVESREASRKDSPACTKLKRPCPMYSPLSVCTSRPCRGEGGCRGALNSRNSSLNPAPSMICATRMGRVPPLLSDRRLTLDNSCLTTQQAPGDLQGIDSQLCAGRGQDDSQATQSP